MVKTNTMNETINVLKEKSEAEFWIKLRQNAIRKAIFLYLVPKHQVNVQSGQTYRSTFKKKFTILIHSKISK